jgi:phosphatidylglycerol:prolipoprotein diacylglycerol transferase
VHPILFERAGFVLHSYSVVLLAAFIVAGVVRRAESRRLGYGAQPGYRWVSVGALVGAVLGSKLGMLLYVERSEWRAVLEDLFHLETSGKTVIGALIGGYLGVEIAKKWVGIRSSTGDAFAVAVPLSLGIGRIACVLGGCCYGTPSSHAWAIHLAGADRHPVQLYEAVLDFALAAALFAVRDRPRRQGDLWKLSLIGYASIRVVLDPWRGDARVWLGPVSAVQVVCAAAICALVLALLRMPPAPVTARTDG